ncbi:hypothetical protein PGT21_004360 [Puccinia graminis f. sp. tritici]|uniref:CxC1-like cysteine cluster associated with KDZ transposases domain-containing protein n=1 Tax=Puccinia graminis f. sp. tritici TaxID=56615 RepID=A0A5B0LPW9_PUCGR|nr:hypothetical protein PGT21_004360 [Puccinia graminis f. sp. tritici]KAA1080009.1 hypothetical protein PGTUg99_020879 [Puccinia graminis f. sp. tritici]
MSHNLYKFHYGCQLPSTKSRSQKTIRLAFEKRTAAEIGQRLKRTINRNRQNQQNNTSQSGAANHHDIQADDFDNEHNELGFNETSLWEDYKHILNNEDKASRARMRLLHQELLQQQKDRNWKDILDALFPTYLHMKKLTANWTLPSAFDNFSALVCSCSPDKYRSREIDLVDLMDPVHLLANGYLASTPVFPQTAFSLRLLNFYDLL